MDSDKAASELPNKYRVNWVRRLMGDREIEQVHIMDVPMDDAILDHIAAVFPEATVVYERKYFPTPGPPDYLRPGPLSRLAMKAKQQTPPVPVPPKASNRDTAPSTHSATQSTLYENDDPFGGD